MSHVRDESVIAVTNGPDLIASRSPLDTKLYRLITLPNGLQALLIQDTIALQQQQLNDEVDDNDYCDEDDDEDDDIEDDIEDEEEEDVEPGGSMLRDAACCILVGVGSASDPPTCHGLAHFLEHLLFMGSEKFPEENEFESFVSKHGGSDNAWTEWEYTTYNLEIPPVALWGALDRLAQFFVNPLLLENAIDRELKSIESEFQLNKNDDYNRRQQLICSVSDPSHPFAKFSWGNIQSLKTIPERLGIDPYIELRNFYNKHYYAQNMRLVIQAAFTLDELQENVIRYFAHVPAQPRDGSCAHQQLRTLERASFPLPPQTLSTVTRIVPVRERHELTITWQIPTQFGNWKSKPIDFLSHLMGHEASGSLLSYARKQSLAFGCTAGSGDEGSENATSHALYSMSFRLSEMGLGHWKDLVERVYEYIGMLRKQCRTGWPSWIYDELKRINELAYHYGDEPTPDDNVEQLAESMAPHCKIPPERILDGSSLLFEFDEVVVQTLLDEYLRPEKARIDLTSSSFGKPSDFEHISVDPSSNETIISNIVIKDENESGTFDETFHGEPQIDPMFGTLFWCHKLSASWIERLIESADLDSPKNEMLGLPPCNPFLPKNFTLKHLPDNDADHPLLYASLKLCIPVRKSRQWFPASVLRFNRKTNAVLLSFEDETEKWHTLDHDEAYFNIEDLNKKKSFEGSMEKRKIKYRIVALARPGAKGVARKFGEKSDHTSYPPIPPPSSHLPQQISDSNVLKLWWYQDRTFKRPLADLRLQIICAKANTSPLFRACADLLQDLCVDALTETSYLAEMCELGSGLDATDMGFSFQIHGFDDKLLDLFQSTFQVFLSFRTMKDELPATTSRDRFDACKEVLQRRYTNSAMSATSLSSSLRIQSMRPNIISSNKLLKALKSITTSLFCETVSSLLENMAVEALIHGNIGRSDADKTRALIESMLDSSGDAGLARKKYPSLAMLRIPSVEAPTLVIVPSRDPEEPNTSCDMYIQVGKDNVRDRTMIDLLIHMMEEPIYDQLRTKDQFGYDVHCDIRWSYGIIGCVFHVTTNVKSATEVMERLDKFLIDFRGDLAEMTKDDYQEHLIGLAKRKLEMFNSMSEETDCLWSEIRDGRFAWESWRDEALCLRSITKSDALNAFDAWLTPGQRRNIFAVHVIGTSESNASQGRPDVKAEHLRDYIDEQVESFHRSCKKQFWGRINTKLF